MSQEILPPQNGKPEEKPARTRRGDTPEAIIKASRRELKQEGKEEQEELTERAYFAKLLVESQGKFDDKTLALLELFDKSRHRSEKRLLNLYVEQRKFIYAQNEVLTTLRDIVQGALTSNVDLVNKYGELKSSQQMSKPQEWLELVNGVLQIPMLAAIQQAAVLYVTKSTGQPPPAAIGPKQPEESTEPE